MNFKEKIKNPNHKTILLILLGFTLIFFIGLLAKPVPFISIDSYSYLNYIQGTTEQIPNNTPVLGENIINILPNNEGIIQVILMIVAFLSSYILSRIGQAYEKNYGWLAGILIFVGLISSKLFFKLETDVFAIPLILASWYFLISYQKKINPSKFFDINLILSIIFLIASGLIWKFAIYFVPIFIVLSKGHIYYILAMAPGILYFNNFIGGLIPIAYTGFTNFTMENMIIIGILDVLAIAYVFSKKFRNPKLESVFWISLIMALINAKLSIIFFFVSCVSVSSSLYKFDEKKIKQIMILAIVFIGYVAYSAFTAIPTQETIQTIDKFDNINANGMDKKVNWGIGYFYNYHSENTTKHKGSFGNRIMDFNNTIALTFSGDEILNKYDCNTLYENGENYFVVECR